MKKLILLSLLLVNYPLFTICQQNESLIKVDDTIINLKKVKDIGLVFESNRKQLNTGVTKELEKRLYASKDGKFHLIAWDSASYFHYSGGYSSKFTSYTNDGQEIFTKHFDDLSVSGALISKDGIRYFINLGSEVDIRFIIYDKNGKVLKDILNQEVYLYSEGKGKLIIFTTEDNENVLHLYNYDQQDETTLTFKEKVYVRNFSPNEEYFTVRCGDSIMVYDRFGDYQFGIKFAKQNLYVFSNQYYYIKYPYPVGKIEVKDFKNHKLIYKIDGVEYKDNKFPVYKSGVIENDNIVWVSNYVGKLQVFNFIDMNGKLINIDSIPSSIRTSDITFQKENNGYQAVY